MRRLRAVAGAIVAASMLLSFARPAGGALDSRVNYVDGVVSPVALALRFAPMLHLNPDEPYHVVSVIAVLHPSKPLIAYHIFFDDDAFLAGRGKSLDHEIAWVEYDPVTLKATGVFTLWHRTVLATESCLMNAKASGQRPTIEVQWGQHGLLPSGWRNLVTARPRLELGLHYGLVHSVARLPKASATRPTVFFRGSYADYLVFTVTVDAADFLSDSTVVTAKRSAAVIESRLGKTFAVKKEWPQW